MSRYLQDREASLSTGRDRALPRNVEQNEGRCALPEKNEGPRSMPRKKNSRKGGEERFHGRGRTEGSRRGLFGLARSRGRLRRDEECNRKKKRRETGELKRESSCGSRARCRNICFSKGPRHYFPIISFTLGSTSNFALLLPPSSFFAPRLSTAPRPRQLLPSFPRCISRTAPVYLVRSCPRPGTR